MESNPYAPPVSSIQGTAELVRAAPVSGFRDISGLTRSLSILLPIGGALKIAAIAAAIMQINLVARGAGSYTRAELLTAAGRLGTVSAGVLVMYITTVVVFARWIYFAQRNLPELGARQLRFTPSAAVSAFFIPVFNLWAPCQAMNQLVRASRDPRTWELEDTPFVIIAWWALWLGNSALRGVLSARVAVPSNGAVELNIVSGAAAVSTYLFAWVIVRRVWRDQSVTHSQQTALGEPVAYEPA